MREKKARNKNIRKKRRQGLTYQAIGELFGGLSRQRIQQIAPRKQDGFWGRLIDKVLYIFLAY